MKQLLQVLLLSVFTVPLNAQNAQRFETIINATSLKDKLLFIAGKETEGRESGTHGQRVAASYIQNKFKLAGLLPGTPGGYQMVYPLYQDTLLDLSFTVNNIPLQVQKDFEISFNAMPSMYASLSDVVFAAYGISDSTRNDYNGLDVSGKWVMLLEGAPGQNGRSVMTMGMAALRAMETKAMIAKSKGAKGIFVVSNSFPYQTPVTLQGRKYVKARPASFPAVYISAKTAGAILNVAADSTKDILAANVGAYKTNIQLSVYKFTKRYASTNVLGILPGTDQAGEYLFITAHYDHLGINKGVISPGADDDGSGTVSVMQIAEAFAQAKAAGKGPRRSIVFMTVSGEEMGLLGSEFYSDNPIYPTVKTTANLNIDMIGRVTPNYKGDSSNYVYLIGDDRLSSRLAPIADSANQMVGLQLDRVFNGNDPQRFYERSDHYNFAKKGVPIIFFFNGTHADYHRPTDTVDKINFELMSKRARLVYHTAWIMANREEMLSRDLPLKK